MANVERDLVERHRIADHVVAILLQVQVLFVNRRPSGLHLHHVVARRLRIQRHQHVRLALARHVAVLAGADREPRRQPGNVRWEQVLPAHGNSHSKNALQQHAVRGLRSRSVDRGYDDAEVVDDARACTAFTLFLTQGQISSRHMEGFPSDEFCRSPGAGSLLQVRGSLRPNM